ncbi:hypothetical protein [Pontivivens ytuae]|uniref:PH domain-containing protein n=1 Tax=Pontivivens ytuae TaxID=2789856 RepID=A0A7S9LU08_9RHOB|nr:hypothetical protein [Pontivivens ytuae]QPH55000.1 hypothetical protein I0K15_04405 [Pontivivens ytuae]
MTEPVFTLTVSPVRRWTGAVVTAGLGLLLIWVAAQRPPEAPWALAVLLGAGGLALWQGWRLLEAGNRAIHLTESALTDERGELLTSLDGIVRIERGIFAFKPSNGFVLVLNEPRPRSWVPGLWWQMGRKLGIGGTARAQDAKVLADMLETLLAQRDAA